MLIELGSLVVLDHPNVINVLNIYKGKDKVYLIEALCDGGDLYARAPYNEQTAGRVVRDILLGVAYMHSHNIAHRDLKLENIMFANKLPDSPVQIIDFGGSTVTKHGNRKYDKRGTPYTLAPEVINPVGHSLPADIWSVGVIAYRLLCDLRYPFPLSPRSALYNSIRSGAFDKDSPAWQALSETARDFVSTLLTVDQTSRPTALQALDHPFMRDIAKSLQVRPSFLKQTSFAARLDLYKTTSHLQRLVLLMLAQRVAADDPTVVRARQVFNSYDDDHSGSLDREEVIKALQELAGIERDAAAAVFASLDADGNGVITWNEFLAATLDVEKESVQK